MFLSAIITGLFILLCLPDSWYCRISRWLPGHNILISRPAESEGNFFSFRSTLMPTVVWNYDLSSYHSYFPIFILSAGHRLEWFKILRHVAYNFLKVFSIRCIWGWWRHRVAWVSEMSIFRLFFYSHVLVILHVCSLTTAARISKIFHCDSDENWTDFSPAVAFYYKK